MTDPSSTPAARPSGERRPKGGWWVWLVAGVLLVTHFALAVGSKRSASTTSDEIVHLTAGYSYWANQDYRLHPENGNLPQRWAALPTWLEGATFPELSGSEYWRYSDVWVLGHQFFYETGEDHFPRLQRGRAMIALFSVGTGLLVFLWSRRLFGDWGALISLTLFAFSPDFLAHGALVTSDACMAFFFLAAGAAWWRHLHDPRLRYWWLSAVTLGLAFVAKYSAVLIIPMMVAMTAVRASAPETLTLAGRQFTTWRGKFCGGALSAAGHAVVVAAVIWGFYSLRYTAFNPTLPPAEHFIRPWADSVGKTGIVGELVRALAAIKALPEAFLYGFDFVLHTSSVRAAFLNGEYSASGWRTFFLWTFALKSTPAVLVLTGALGMLTARIAAGGNNSLSRLYPFTPLIALFVVYWAASIASHLNIGHRHILPTYPVLFIAAGAFATLGAAHWLKAASISLLLGWHVFEGLRYSPHHLAYFNVFAGGPQNGWRHLVDSSLDWGQDLPTLKTWLDRNAGSERTYLSYFGTGQPLYYGIRAHPTAPLNLFKFPPSYAPFEAGIYCVSATIVQQVYTPVGPWTLDREKEYQELRALEPLFAAFTHEPARREELLRQTPLERWHAGIKRFDFLRMARLAAYLRAREPDASAGYSILIYRLTAAEVKAATAGSFSDWTRLVEDAARKGSATAR
jgi:hypothetical protein